MKKFYLKRAFNDYIEKMYKILKYTPCIHSTGQVRNLYVLLLLQLFLSIVNGQQKRLRRCIFSQLILRLKKMQSVNGFSVLFPSTNKKIQINIVWNYVIAYINVR